MRKGSRAILGMWLLTGLVFAVSPRVWSQSDTRAPQKSAQSDKQRREAAPANSSQDQSGQMKELDLQRQMDELKVEEERERLNMLRFRPQEGFERVAPVFVFLVFMGALIWIVRVIIESRRWNRMLHVQSELHTKLLDRFSSSQELLAYIESEAGKKFLESGALDVSSKHPAAAPFGRILWSAQAGLILAILGSGLILLRGHIPGDGSGNGDAALLLFGTIGLTLGLGFLLSAVVSYVLSKRFGLLNGRKEALGAPRG